MQLKIKQLNENSTIPSYARKYDAGMDLFASEEVVITSVDKITLIKTGIAMELPPGYVGLIWDKSGIATKYGLKVLGGVIDAGYRGEIIVGLANVGRSNLRIKPGNKIAQILFQEVERADIKVVKELTDSERGTGGFGSTGK